MKRVGKRSPAVLALAISIVVAAGGIGIAAIPDSQGTVTACLNTFGSIRVIDTADRSACGANERTLRLASANLSVGGDLTGTLPAPRIAPGVVTGDKIANSAIDRTHLGVSSVTETELAVEAVNSGAIKDGTIGSDDIADGGVALQDIDLPALLQEIDDRAYTVFGAQQNITWRKSDGGRTETRTVSCRPGDVVLSGNYSLLGGHTVARVGRTATNAGAYSVSLDMFNHQLSERGGNAEDVVGIRLFLQVDCLDVTP